MNKHKIRIVHPAQGADAYSVELDGQEISHVLRGVSFAASSATRQGGPQITLDLRPMDVDISSEGGVAISEASRNMLVALGWTPPKVVGDIRDLRDIQGRNGTWNYSGYMRGMYNGLELALSILEGQRDPQYKEEPAKDGYLCDRPTPDMSGPEFEPASDNVSPTPPAGDQR